MCVRSNNPFRPASTHWVPTTYVYVDWVVPISYVHGWSELQFANGNLIIAQKQTYHKWKKGCREINIDNSVAFLSENQNPLTSYWKDTTLQFPCGSGHCVCYHPFSQSFDLNWTLESFPPSKTCQTRCSSKNDLTKNRGYTESVGHRKDMVCRGALLNLVYHHKTTLQSVSNCVSSCLHCYLYPCLIIGHQDLTKVDLMTNLIRPLLFEAIIFRL